MKKTRWFPSLVWFRAPRRSAPRRPGFRPSLETLEDRQVPAVVHWTGAAGDSQWLTAGNWDGGQLPGAEDDVVIDVADDATVVYAGGETTINSLESAESLDLVSGTLTVVNGVNLTAGTITESGGAIAVPVKESEETTVEETKDPPVEETLPEDDTSKPEAESGPPEDDTMEEPVLEVEVLPDDTTGEPEGEIVVTALPMETVQPTPRRNQTKSTVIVPPPAAIALDLQAASDSGVSSSDNLTNQTTVVFDVTINQAGQVKIDYTGDGLWDVRRNCNDAGTYHIEVAGLREGQRTVMVRLQPVAAVTPSLTSMGLDVDTTGPRLLDNSAPELSPAGSRAIAFSETLDASSLGTTEVKVRRPDGTQAAVTGVSGSGANFMVQFAASSAWGRYRVRVGPDVRDPAGNRMDQDGDGVQGEARQDIGVNRFFVNRAPELDSSGAMQLPSIPKNAFGNLGVSVLKLLASAGGDRITDSDPGAKEGIAVIGVDDTHGKWQFSMDGGQSWANLKNVSASSARLLSANRTTRVRFVPAKDFVGVVDPGLTFRAWDRTAGVNGGTIAIGDVGGASALSTAIETASIAVIA